MRICLFTESNVSPLHLIHQPLAVPPGEREDGERRIFVGIRWQHCAVHEEEILHVPCLAVLIRHAIAGLRAHARRTDFVDDLAGALDSISTGLRIRLAAHAFEHFGKRVLHVLHFQ